MKSLNKIDEIRLLDYDDSSSPHLAILVLKNKYFRDSLRNHLKKRGIQTLIHYPIPCHMQDFLKPSQFAITETSAIQAEKISNTILSLPMSEVHSNKEINYVKDCIDEYFDYL